MEVILKTYIYEAIEVEKAGRLLNSQKSKQTREHDCSLVCFIF
jgi:hypothetical protein